MTDQTLPYTQSAASLEVPPPYNFPGVSAYAFVWDAEIERIQAFCDTFLNLRKPEELGFVYRPATFWPYTLLLFINYPYMFSTCPAPKDEIAYADRGYVSQTEVFVAFPVVREGVTDQTRLADTEMEWCLPFIAVANGMSAACGREMVGLPKLLAEIEANEVPGAFTGTVKMLRWPDNGQPAQHEMASFLTVKVQPCLAYKGLIKDRQSPWTVLPGRLGGMLMEGLALTREMADVASLGMAPLAMRTVSLRQYRDAGELETAVYQAIVTCRFSYANIRNFQFYNETEVTIAFNGEGSFSDIVRSFHKGPDGAKYAPEPKAAFRFDADMAFDDMRTVHTFASEGYEAGAREGDARSSWARAWEGFWPPKP